VQREADRLLLSKYVPSAVVVNDELDILQSRGRTNRYLELPTGRASLNLLKMARAGLLYELRALIDKARKSSIPVAQNGVVIEEENEATSVDWKSFLSTLPPAISATSSFCSRKKTLSKFPSLNLLSGKLQGKYRMARKFKSPN
jgi:hypothetical protein